MKRCLAFNAALLLCLLGALTLRPVEGLAAPARERILLFDATAVFDSTGTMEVTERITVHAAGQRIVRGIFRKLPRMWQREDGKRFALEYGIVAVQRDGKPEPYTVRKSDRDLTLYIGNEGAKLAPGTHEYALTYTVSNHFSRFPDWDELYWNVTGNAWDFPIDKARFRLLFRPSKGAEPVPMPMRSLDLYTGSQGERGKNARQLSNGIIETTKALARGQGLTIAWSWPRSLLADVPAPREYSHWKALLLPTSRTLFFWILPLWMAGYFAFLYFTKRPGPMPAIIPLFKAPDGLSPGSLRYALKGSYDGTAFAADLLHLVAKGAVSLNAQSVPPTLRKDFGVRYRGGVLQAEEQQALDRLFAQSDSVNLT
ncbi:MAG: DUF2207 domain-containing protein, partial [Deltaproteobacteria bacterium]|nr:DUF2207 domain-containing protein [Deltaproteobacteria bacterium]